MSAPREYVCAEEILAIVGKGNYRFLTKGERDWYCYFNQMAAQLDEDEVIDLTKDDDEVQIKPVQKIKQEKKPKKNQPKNKKH